MRVVYLNPSAQMGGAEVALLDFLASLREAEPAWRLYLILSDDGPVAVKARALGVETAVVPFPRSLARLGDSSVGGPAGRQQRQLALIAGMVIAAPGILSYVKRLSRVIRNWAPDLIHTNGFKMHILGAWTAPRGIPLIWHIHDYVSARPLMVRLLRRYSKRCALALANSKSVAADIQAVCGDGLQVKTIYNGIDLESFSPEGPTLDLDALSGLPPANSDTVRVGMLATMARWKGHEVFLRAMALIPDDLPVRGYIAGGPIYQTNGSQHSLDELKRQVNQLGLSQRVGLTGFVDNPSAAMRALDIVVHASTQPEPFGLVIAEGMACGRAVVASQSGGAAELIESGFNALGHAPGDAETLARCIVELMTKPKLRAQLGVAARATAERHFGRERLAVELIPFYKSLMLSVV